MKRSLLAGVAIAVLSLTMTVHAYAATTLSGGSACSVPGTTVNIPFTFTGDGSTSAVQFDVTFDDSILTPGAPVLGPGAPAHTFDWNVVSAGRMRLIVFSATNTALVSGVLATVPFDIDLSAPAGAEALPLADWVFANPGLLAVEPTSTPTGAQVTPVIVSSPPDRQSCNGSSTTLTVAVSGASGLGYQWSKDGEPIAGATSASYTIPIVTSDTMGTYTCALGSAACGSFSSAPAAIDVPLSPCAPANLTIWDAGTTGSLFAAWSPNPSWEIDRYRLYWSATPDGPYVNYVDTGAGVTTQVSGLANNQRYYFRVSDFVESFESPMSAEVSGAATTGIAMPSAPDFGYMTTPSNDTAHPDQISYSFPGRPGVVTVWYDGLDIDYTGEVRALINGKSAGFIPVNPSYNWSGMRTLVLPDDLVADGGQNVLTFDQLAYPGTLEAWGMRRVSLKVGAPTVTAEPFNTAIDLTIVPPVAWDIASWDIFRSTNPAFTPSLANRIATGVTGTFYRNQSGLVNGTTYYYVVRPIDPIANPGFDSAKVSAVPSSLTVTPIVDLVVADAGNDLLLSWSPVPTEGGVREYRIYEGADAASLAFTGQVTTETSFLRAGDAVDGRPHVYGVSVIDNSARESK